MALVTKGISGLLRAKLSRPARASTTELGARGWNQVVSSHSYYQWEAISYFTQLAAELGDKAVAKGTRLKNIEFKYHTLTYKTNRGPETYRGRY